MAFGIIPATEWKLDESIGTERKARLLNTPFGEIVSLITMRGKIVRCTKEPLDKDPRYSRVVVELLLPRKVVDLFHNGAGGYRAQYYLSISEGENANRHVIDALRPEINNWLALHTQLGWSGEIVETSVGHPQTKIWINEGPWQTDGNLFDRNLVVDRWRRNAEIDTKWYRFEKWWAELTPDNETRLALKGGWIDADLRAALKGKQARSYEIHSFGYT